MIRTFVIFLVFLLLHPVSLIAQSNGLNSKKNPPSNLHTTPAISRADSLFNLAEELHKQRKNSETVAVLEEANELFLEQKDYDKVVSCYTRIGRSTKFQFKPFEQVENLLRPGLQYVSHEQVTKITKAWFYLELANSLSEQKKLRDAEFFIEKGHHNASQVTDFNSKNLNIIRMVRGSRAGIQHYLHNYLKVEEILLDNISFYKEHGLGLTFTYNMLLEAYNKSGQNEKFDLLLKQMQTNGIIEEESYYNKYMHYLTLTENFISTRQFERAESTIAGLKALIGNGKNASHFGRWYIERMLIEIYIGNQEYQKAIDIIEQISTDTSLQQTQLENLANNFGSKALAYLELNELDSSRVAIQNALKVLLPNNRTNEPFLKKATYHGLPYKLNLANTLHFKGRLLNKLGANSADSIMINVSLHNFEQAHEVLKELGEDSNEDQFLSNDFFKTFYEHSLLAFHNEWETDENPQLFYRALRISDESRHLTVLNELKTSTIKDLFANVPVGLRMRINQISIALDSLNTTNTGSLKSKKRQSHFEELQRDLKALKSKLKSEHPKYYEIKYGSNNSIKDLVQTSYKNSNILEYFWGKQFLFVFQINGEVLKFDKIRLTKKLNENKNSLVNSLRNPLDNDYKEAGQFIFDSLFKNYISRTTKNLLILDDALHFIPIESLWVESSKSGNFLLGEAQVHRLNSIAQGINQEESKHESAMLLAPFATYKGSNFSKISRTKNEVDEIQKYVEAQIYLDSLATKSTFLENAEKFGILHLATHSTAEPENPLKSRILFYDDENLVPSDKSLTIEELYSLELNANLVVLSACETGIGKDVKGRGIASISNGFNYAGVSSTLMSLWKVPDKQTSQIMVGFYKYLQEGLPKNIALQEAKLAYLRTTDDELLRHPYYWAGFVVSGNMEPLQKNANYWWWLLGFAIAGCSLWLLGRKIYSN